MHRNTQINILVLHKDAIIAAGLAAILAAESDVAIIEEHDFSMAAFSGKRGSDIVVADYDTGVKLATQYRGQTRIPEAAPKILIVTSDNREWEVHAALNIGVHGYLLQQCSREELVVAIRALYSGNNYVCQAVSQSVICSLSHDSLTPREAVVLALLVNGACNRSIADSLGITIHTTKAHVKAILEKLNAASRTEAAAIATRRGLVCNRQGAETPVSRKSHSNPETGRVPHIRQHAVLLEPSLV